MNSTQSSFPASIFRPLAFALLGMALLASGLYQSVNAYPDPLTLSHLGEALTAMWAAIGFLAGLAMLLIGLALLAPSVYLLRRRWQRRQGPSGYIADRKTRQISAPATDRRSQDDCEFEDHPGGDYRFGPAEDLDPYRGNHGGPPDEYEDRYEDGRGDHFDNGRGRARNHGRFDQRRWAETSRR
jgi:hypothetical protein